MTFYAVAFNFPKRAAHLHLMGAALLACPNWCHYIDSFWIVGTEETAGVLAARIVQHVPEKERPMLFVTELKPGDRQGRLPKEAWSWLDENLPLEVASDAPR